MQTHIFNSQVPVSFREDGYLNATTIAAHFGKRVPDFIKTEQTQAYISALAEILSETNKIVLEEKRLVIVKKGGNEQGTWLHPKLAIHFARWLDARFAVWCDMKIEEILGISQEPTDTRITPAQKQQIQQAVQQRHHRTGEHWQEIYRKLHAYCQVNSYHEIAAADFDAALGYLNSIQDAPEIFRQSEAPKPEIDQATLISIGRVLLHAQDMRLFVNRYLPAFENLGIDNKGALWSYVHDTEPAFARVRGFFTARCHALGHWPQDSNLEWVRRRVLSTAAV